VYSKVDKYARDVSEAAIAATAGIRHQFGLFPDERQQDDRDKMTELVQANNVVLSSAILSAVTFENEEWVESTTVQEKIAVFNRSYIVAKARLGDKVTDAGDAVFDSPMEQATAEKLVEHATGNPVDPADVYSVSYYEHDRIVSAALMASWDKHIRQPGLHRALHEARGQLHDSWGARINKDQTSPLATDRLIVSPIVVRTLLEKLGVSEEYSLEAAQDHLALTRQSGRRGMEKYRRFNDRVARRAGAIPTRLACATARHNYLKNTGMTDPSSEAALMTRAGKHATSDAQLREKFSKLVGSDIDLHLFGLGIGSLSEEEIQASRDNSIMNLFSQPDLVDIFKPIYYA
jgi:hypothetical protein